MGKAIAKSSLWHNFVKDNAFYTNNIDKHKFKCLYPPRLVNYTCYLQTKDKLFSILKTPITKFLTVHPIKTGQQMTPIKETRKTIKH